MAAITAQMVKELRDKTSAGMSECKKALVESDGDMNAAVEYLRKTGIAKSENRQDRATKEGIISIANDGKKAVMVEILCETDFVAKNDKFIEYGKNVAEKLLAQTSGCGDITAQAQEIEAEEIKAMFTQFGEKMVISRALRYESENVVAHYLYENKIGLLVEIAGESDAQLQKDICMHITAFKPAYVRSSEIPQEAIDHEKEISAAQLLQEGKKPEMIEKIVVGKINKWFGEVCLVNQPWFRDDKTTLGKLYPNVNVVRFTRWAAGVTE